MQLAHGAPPPGTRDREVTEAQIRSTLEAILESSPFRTSKQCQSLLSHVVDLSLKGNTDSLRERALGVEVFGRAPNYNTSEDPVVRMRAADVRKRLAQYYQSTGDGGVVIELPPGSYRVFFRAPQAAAPVQPATALAPVQPAPAQLPLHPELAHDRPDQTDQQGQPEQPGAAILPVHAVAPVPRHWTRLLLLALVVVLAGAAAYLTHSTAHLSAQERFWEPLTSSRKPILIDLGSNVAYRFTPEYMARYERAHGAREYTPETFIDLPPHGTISTDDLLPVQNTFVTVGDLAGSTQLVSLLSGWHKAFVLRSAADITIGDLRNTPTVLIGGFNNPWTLEATKNMRFSLAGGDRIVDRADPRRIWKMDNAAHVNAADDYALITRTPRSELGGPLITASGVGQYGTQAAGEFLADRVRMEELLRTAPPGWESKSMQVVLHVRIVGFAPAAVEVAAVHYW